MAKKGKYKLLNIILIDTERWNSWVANERPDMDGAEKNVITLLLNLIARAA